MVWCGVVWMGVEGTLTKKAVWIGVRGTCTKRRMVWMWVRVYTYKERGVDGGKGILRTKRGVCGWG